MEEYLGVIKLFAGNYAPVGYLLCQGQQLPIAQYQALYAVLGTMYGGDGLTYFNLPDLQGRVPVGVITTNTNYVQGVKKGTENTTLTVQNLPAHTHLATLKANSAAGNSAAPSGNVLANTGGTDTEYTNVAPNVNMNASAIEVQSVGSNTAFSNMPPYQTFNYIICYEGLFPVRP